MPFNILQDKPLRNIHSPSKSSRKSGPKRTQLTKKQDINGKPNSENNETNKNPDPNTDEKTEQKPLEDETSVFYINNNPQSVTEQLNEMGIPKNNANKNKLNSIFFNNNQQISNNNNGVTIANELKQKTKKMGFFKRVKNYFKQNKKSVKKEVNHPVKKGKTKTKWSLFKKKKLDKLVIPEIKYRKNNKLRCTDNDEKEECIQAYNCEWRPIKWKKRTLNNIKEKEGINRKYAENNTVYGCVDNKKRYTLEKSINQEYRPPPIRSPKSILKLKSRKKISKKSKFTKGKKSPLGPLKLGPLKLGPEPELLVIKKKKHCDFTE